MINDDTTMYVCGFVSDGGVGGFEWRLDRAEIDRVRAEWLADGDSDVSDVKEITVDQLQLAPGDYATESITDAIDQWPELWEPTLGQNRTAPVPTPA